MKPGCSFSGARYGKLNGTTRLSTLRKPCKRGSPLISDAITSGSTGAPRDSSAILRCLGKPPGIHRLPHPLDLQFADRVRDPLRRSRLARAQKDFRRGLRQHGFRFVPVARLQLAAALEAQHHRIVRFAVLRDRRVQLRQLLQARQFVQHEPRGRIAGSPWFISRSTSSVQPQARQRQQPLAKARSRSQKQPAASLPRPFFRRPRCFVSLFCGNSFSESATMLSDASTPPAARPAPR